MLSTHGFKVCSQNGEDGIIEYIFQTVGATSKVVVEIGFGAVEANSLNLIKNGGWKGLWIDANPCEVVLARGLYADKALNVVHALVSPENVNMLLSDYMALSGNAQIDLLSIDVDGVDYHIWKALTVVKPRVVVIEYNASFGAVDSVTVPYREKFDRFKFHSLYHGASLAALVKLGASKGYKFVGVDGNGVNAFFVLNDLPLHEVDVVTAFVPHSKRGMQEGLTEKFKAEFGLMEV